MLNLTAFTKHAVDEAKHRKQTQTQMEDEEQLRRHESQHSTESHMC